MHVISSLNVGGAERFVIDLATAQRQKAYIEILSMGDKGEPLEAELDNLKMPLHLSISLKGIRKIIRKFDVVHVHSSHCLLRVLLASLGLRIKVVYTRHNEFVHNGLKWRFIYKLANFKLHKMLFVADKARVKFLAHYPQYSKKAQTILNGVKPIKKLNTNNSKFKLGHVGRFVPLKSQHILIEAVSKLPEEIQNKISLSLYGTGELLKYNQELAKKLIPHVEVYFFGFESDRNRIYTEIDLLVVTSETEGLSLAILESFAAKTPVIASDVGGNPELIKNNYNGFLYPYANSNKLAKRIATVFREPSMYQAFAQNCLNEYHQKYSLEICTRTHFDCYQ